MDKVYHDFQINDVVWLKHVGCFYILGDKQSVSVADSTSDSGIRKATKSEARKFRKQEYRGRKAY